MDQATTHTAMPATIEAVAASTIRPSSSTSAAMPSVNLPNFEVECEKAKQHLSLFEDAISKKKELDDVTESIEEHDRALKDLLEEKNRADSEREAKTKQFELSFSAFKEKESKWYAQKPSLKDILYLPICGESQVEAIPRIRGQIKLAKENLALLEVHLETKEKSALLQASHHAIEILEEGIATEKKVGETLKEDEKRLAMDFNDAVSTWRTNYSESSSTKANNKLAPKSGSTAKDIEVADLKAEILSLNATIDAKTKKIASVEGEDCRKQPIVQIGLDILVRKREQSKPQAERDEAIIEQGNKAAHNGTALADARRLLLNSDTRDEKEWAWYEAAYVVSPDVVSRIETNSPKTLDLLDWNFSIRSSDTLRAGLKEDFENHFLKVAGSLKGCKPEHNKAVDMNMFLETDYGKSLYDRMKALYIESQQYRKLQGFGS